MSAYVGLGANLGDPAQALTVAIAALDRIEATRVVRASSFYRSAPVGYAAQPEFVNAVVRLETRREPRELLESLLAIEEQAGRQRSFANAPRTLDVDLLLYGDATIQTPELTVPHPRMHQRRFVLEPLLELSPGCIIPGLGRAAEHLAATQSQAVAKLSRP